MTSAHWEVITVMLWGPDISAEIFRYPTTKNCVRAFTFKVRASFFRDHSDVKRSDVIWVRFWTRRAIASDWSVGLALNQIQVGAAL